MNRAPTRIATGALSALALLASCERRDSAPAEADPSSGGTAIVGLNAEMQSFNPLTNTDLNTAEVNAYVLFTPLIQYDQAFEPRPYLAQRWELDAEGVTFFLNTDVSWHDGRPVTAHDVAFTFQRAKTPETASILESVYLERIQSAEVIDSFTIRFAFSGPHARPLDGFWWAPVPRHLLSDIEPAELGRAAFNRQPVGSGPFKFVEWRSGETITFERNDEFPESLGGPPKLDRVIFRFIPEATTLLSEALSGRVDVDGSLHPHQAAEIQGAANLRLIGYPSREYYYIGWNTRDPLLGDPGVRRALTMAIDRPQLVDALLFGHGQLATGTIAPWHPLFSPIDPLPYDPAAASQLLAQNGWTDRDGDGTIEDPAGNPFRFTLMTNHENPVRTDIAQIVQARLADIGVAVAVRTLEWGTLLSRHRSRDFQAVVQSWVLDNFRVDPFALFHSSQADRPGSYNRSGFSDPRVDRVIETATRTVDADEAAALWAEFSTLLQEGQPFTFLMWLDELAAVSDRVRGVEMDARGILVGVHDWWIPPERRRTSGR